MSLRDRPPFRADHVGSLLRPPELLEARERFAGGAIDAAALRAAEDGAIADAVALQRDVAERLRVGRAERADDGQAAFERLDEGAVADGGLGALLRHSAPSSRRTSCARANALLAAGTPA